MTLRPRICSALTLLALGGCGGTSDIVETGPGSYMVASHSMMGHSSGPEEKAHAYQKASAYCQQSRKHVETISATDTGAGVWGKVSSAEVNFRCVTPAQ